MNKSFMAFLVTLLLSLPVFAGESEVFYSLGGVSYHHQKIEGYAFNEVHPGFGAEYIGTIFKDVSALKYSVLGHYMAKDSFESSAYWVGAAGFYRFEPFSSWELDLGLGVVYLNKNLARWKQVNGETQIRLLENQRFLPIPYIGVNKRFSDGFVISKVGVNLLHTPRISGVSEISATYLQVKVSF